MSSITKEDKSPEWWDEAIQQLSVCDNNKKCYFHPSLHFSESTRELSLTSRRQQKDNDNNSNGEATSTVILAETGTLIMRIPSSNLISTRSLDIPLSDPQKEKKKKMEFHYPPSDVFLAYAMAQNKNNNRILHTYLKTLPSSPPSLPCRWSDDEIDKYLKGSPLLKRTKEDKRGLRNDYDLLLSSNHDEITPSFDKFCDMMGVITSRAFSFRPSSDTATDQEEEEEEAITTLVPLLDLCNHIRGGNIPGIASPIPKKKNLTYTQVDDGSIEVRSCQTINNDDVLTITYGALSNSQLLRNYGFTLPCNIEPDGSSNDMLEFDTSFEDDEIQKTILHLQTGPKSYTYGSFTKLLDEIMKGAQDGNINDNKRRKIGDSNPNNDDDDENSMDAFLDGCENEENDYGDDGDNFSDMMYGDINDDGDDEEDEDELMMMWGGSPSILDKAKIAERELSGLHKLKQILLNKMNTYDDSLTTAAAAATTESLYSQQLIQSEKRCLYFYLQCVEKVETRVLTLLKKKEKTTASDSDSCSKTSVGISKDDLELISKQTDELTDVFMKIRHPEELK